MNNLVIKIKNIVTLDNTLLVLLQNLINTKGSKLPDNSLLKVTKTNIKVEDYEKN